MLINAKDFRKTIMETLDYPMDDNFDDLVMRFIDRCEIDKNMSDDEIQEYVYGEVSDYIIYYKDMWTILEYYQWGNISENKLDFDDAMDEFTGDMIQVLIAIRDEINDTEEAEDLPTEVTYDFYTLVDDDIDIEGNDYNLDEEIADRLSDDYGYTHFGFDYDINKDTQEVYVYNIQWDKD